MSALTEKELKPCPFCGRKACIINTGNHYPRAFYRIVCQSCYTVQGKFYDTEEESIEAWNKRVCEE